MKTKPRRFRNGALHSVGWVLILLASWFIPSTVPADGCFVFVWNKHKDINEPTQKAIIAYDAGHEDLLLQVKYDGPVEDFGWLIPTPNLPTVQKASMDCFYEISRYTQELWEPRVPQSRGEMPEEKPVKVVEIKTVGAYEIAVLSAKDTGALHTWLDTNHFSFPAGGSDVIDSYIKQKWYFVAVKIRLGHEGRPGLLSALLKGSSDQASVSNKLSSGELHPLHLSFATEKCVFPLKISSVNGKPSEVQVYVLSKEPLLERTMFERKLPEIYSSDVAHAEGQARSFELRELASLWVALGDTNLQLSARAKDEMRTMRETIRTVNELPHYVKVTTKELPKCSHEISSLANSSWWLTKKTWTFSPEEMQDLAFEPAIPTFVEKLDSKYGYYTAGCLTELGSDAVPAVLAGLQSTNHTIRSAIISAFDSLSYIYTAEILCDLKFREGLGRMSRDPDPEIRKFVLQEIEAPPEALLAAMHDEDSGVVMQAADNLRRHLTDVPEATNYIPAIEAMLKDTNANTRFAALVALIGARIEIPREELLRFFTVSNFHAVVIAGGKLEGRGGRLSNEEVALLLQHSDPYIRRMGLKKLYDKGEKSSVEMALPLLRDGERAVALSAAATLRALTGQHFTADHADEWQKWWEENKTNFTVQLHPEEIYRRYRFDTNWRQSLRGIVYGPSAATNSPSEQPEDQR